VAVDRRLTVVLIAVGLVALLVVIPLAISRGSDRSGGPDPNGGDKTRAFLVSARDIAASPRNSPQRAVLEWWRAVQFGDHREARRFYAGEVDGAELRQITQNLAALMRRTRPVVVQSKIARGRQATVRTLLQVGKLQQAGGRPTGATGGIAYEEPATFYLNKDGLRWKLADNRFLERRNAAVLRAEALAERPDR
jgi:hypothetical protein